MDVTRCIMEPLFCTRFTKATEPRCLEARWSKARPLKRHSIPARYAFIPSIFNSVISGLLLCASLIADVF